TKTITVTDLDDGGAEVVLVEDEFDRTVINGWGIASTGATWTHTGALSSYSVTGGVGRLELSSAGMTRMGVIGPISTTDVDTTLVFSLDSPPSGGGVLVSSMARRVGLNTEYRLRLRLEPAQARLQVMRVVSGVETVLA